MAQFPEEVLLPIPGPLQELLEDDCLWILRRAKVCVNPMAQFARCEMHGISHAAKPPAGPAARRINCRGLTERLLLHLCGDIN